MTNSFSVDYLIITFTPLAIAILLFILAVIFNKLKFKRVYNFLVKITDELIAAI